MGRRKAARDVTMEQFNAWSEATRNVDEVLDATSEEGGPFVSLVPIPHSAPVDFLPDEVDLPARSPGDCRGQISAPVPAGLHAVPFDPEPSRKTGGWSADRQRRFVAALAETGTVHMAAKTAGLSARGAYALRVRSPAFANAWDVAQQLAVGRLSALAFDRAIHGHIEQIFDQGQLVAEKRVPSERLLIWLLARLDPKRFAAPWERRKDDISDPQEEAQRAFPALLDSLTDVAEE